MCRTNIQPQLGTSTTHCRTARSARTTAKCILRISVIFVVVVVFFLLKLSKQVLAFLPALHWESVHCSHILNASVSPLLKIVPRWILFSVCAYKMCAHIERSPADTHQWFSHRRTCLSDVPSRLPVYSRHTRPVVINSSVSWRESEKQLWGNITTSDSINDIAFFHRVHTAFCWHWRSHSVRGLGRVGGRKRQIPDMSPPELKFQCLTMARQRVMNPT